MHLHEWRFSTLEWQLRHTDISVRACVFVRVCVRVSVCVCASVLACVLVSTCPPHPPPFPFLSREGAKDLMVATADLHDDRVVQQHAATFQNTALASVSAASEGRNWRDWKSREHLRFQDCHNEAPKRKWCSRLPWPSFQVF